MKTSKFDQVCESILKENSSEKIPPTHFIIKFKHDLTNAEMEEGQAFVEDDMSRGEFTKISMFDLGSDSAIVDFSITASSTEVGPEEVATEIKEQVEAIISMLPLKDFGPEDIIPPFSSF